MKIEQRSSAAMSKDTGQVRDWTGQRQDRSKTGQDKGLDSRAKGAKACKKKECVRAERSRTSKQQTHSRTRLFFTMIPLLVAPDLKQLHDFVRVGLQP